MSDPTPPTRGAWPDYRAVWRWHFYAGLFCLPFVTVLTLSGSLYLFRPQIESWLERPYDELSLTEPAKSPGEQVRAALDQLPGAVFQTYEFPAVPEGAGRVLVRHQGERLRLYVHPATLQVLHQTPDGDRLMRYVFRLHGELLLGENGSHLVELAASWTILLILTGFYLWWPRNARGLAGVAYPRLGSGGRVFWRDLHAVTGLWVSAFTLILLLSGLPWSKFWGEYFKTVRRWAGQTTAGQEWSTRGERESPGLAQRGGEHAEHGSADRAPATPPDFAALDRVAAAVAPLGLPAPVQISPPASGSESWTVKSMTANRPRRVTLKLDGATGEILHRDDFSNRARIDQLVSIGIALHEGQLFGWPNQALGLATAAGLLLVCVSGAVLWWRRRDAGVLGAPPVGARPRFAVGLLAIVVTLAALLPLFGLSLLSVLLVERLVLRQVRPVAVWLGLHGTSA